MGGNPNSFCEINQFKISRSYEEKRYLIHLQDIHSPNFLMYNGVPSLILNKVTIDHFRSRHNS